MTLEDAPTPVVVKTDDPRLASLLAAGFVETHRSWAAELVAPDRHLLEALLERWLRVGSVRALCDDDIQGALTLDGLTDGDYPGGAATSHRPLTPESARPGAARAGFGAFVGDELVAMTYLDVDRGERVAETDFTVVAESWRGKGVASAVKAAAVLSLNAEGITTFRTGGASENTWILAANVRLGYVIDEEWVTLERRTEGDAGA